jgi:hypothetical protein
MACELTPLFGMHRDGLLEAATPQGHQQRIENKAGIDPAEQSQEFHFKGIVTKGYDPPVVTI